MHLLSGDYLFNTPIDNPSSYFWALTAAFAVLLIASVLAYWRRAKLTPENPVLRRVIRRASKAGIWTACIGLFFAAMRIAQVDYLGMPIWILLDIFAIIAVAGYFTYELSERYPLAVWRLEESSLERKYRPAARPAREPQRIRPKERGKRRR